MAPVSVTQISGRGVKVRLRVAAPRDDRQRRHVIRPSAWQLVGRTEREAISKVGHQFAFAPGTVLGHISSDWSNTVTIIRSGLAKTVSADKRTILRLHSAGDVIGHEAVFLERGVPLLETTVTISDTFGVRVPLQRFEELLGRFPTMYRALYASMVDRTLESDYLRNLAMLGSSPLVAHGLGFLAVRYGEETDDGSPSLPLSQDDVARLLGTSRETLVRALKDLREAGAVRTTRGAIAITDFEALDKYGDPAIDRWRFTPTSAFATPDAEEHQQRTLSGTA